MSNQAVETDPLPTGALCRQCGYSLRGLTQYRCPECGSGFDPAQRWTMAFDRPTSPLARWATEQPSAPLRRLILIQCFAVFWGLAWLPGGLAVAAFVGLSLIPTAGYAIACDIVRRLLRIRYPDYVPARPAFRWPRWATITLVLLLFFGFTTDVSFITIQLNRPFYQRQVRHAYEQEPLDVAKLPAGWYGLFYIDGASIQPEGVYLNVRGGGTIRYDDRAGFSSGQSRFFPPL